MPRGWPSAPTAGSPTLLNHQFIERKPIILYASPTDFQQTNALGGDIGEGDRRRDRLLEHRAIMPFTGAVPRTSSTS